MKKISFVIPCYRSEETINVVIGEIEQEMKKMKFDYEIVLVNDSSPDRTWQVIHEITENHFNVMSIDLAKNFGQHAAIMAGLHFVTGDVICCLDDDGQTPVSELYKLLSKLEEGYDVVYAKYTNKKHSAFRNFGSRINAKMTESLLQKPKNLYVSSYFVAKKFIIDQILKYNHTYPYLIGLILRTTNKIANAEVNHRERTIGKSGYTVKKLFALWVNGFTAFSVKPLRIATVIGAITGGMGFIYMLYTILKKIFIPNVPVGWSSIISILLFLGGIILLMLGIIGEYIGRIYICINNSPQFVIREIRRSGNDV